MARESEPADLSAPGTGARRNRVSRRKVAMGLYGPIAHDSRVRREAATLAERGYDVTIVCLDATGSSDADLAGVSIQVVRPTASAVTPGVPSPFLIAAPGRVRGIVAKLRWLTGYVRNLRAWGRAAFAVAPATEVWHLHDLTALVALGPLVPATVPIVYDAHELFLETGTARRLPSPVPRLLRAYERRLVSRVRAVVTVNASLANVILRRYAPRHVAVIHNCPPRWEPPLARPTLLRDTLRTADAPIVLYHGALSSHRGIEELMQALLRPGMDDVHLALLGFGEKRDDYLAAASKSDWNGRVHVLDPVPPDELLPWVASADVGAATILPSTLNHYLSTPNKLFECLAAGTPVVASDFPAIRAVVDDEAFGTLGALCNPADVAQVAAGVHSILALDAEARAELRKRCLQAAQTRWNWESEAVVLTRLYGEIFGSEDERSNEVAGTAD